MNVMCERGKRPFPPSTSSVIIKQQGVNRSWYANYQAPTSNLHTLYIIPCYIQLGKHVEQHKDTHQIMCLVLQLFNCE